MARTGIPFYEHVIRHDAQPHLRLPQARPRFGIVVDVGDERPLATDDGPRAAHTTDRGLRGFRFKLFPVVVMRHDRHLLAGLDQAFQQLQQAVRIRRAEETVRPERQRLGADAYGLDMVELGLKQRFEIVRQMRRLHHHRVAAGQEHVGDFAMGAQVIMQLRRFGAGNAQVLVAHELGPAETEGAIRVAGLALTGEEQHRLAIFVLQAVQPHALVVAGHVHFHLIGRMRIKVLSHLVDGGIEHGLIGPLANKLGDPLVMFGGQHAPLGERELIDGIVRNVVPVDQFVDDVLVDAERQYRRHHFHFKALRFIKLLQRGDTIKVTLRINLERNCLVAADKIGRGVPHNGSDLRTHASSSRSQRICTTMRHRMAQIRWTLRCRRGNIKAWSGRPTAMGEPGD